jgi:acyl-CoA thioesterase FadM
VLGIAEKSIRFCHEMSNDETGELAARTILVGVYFDTSARKSRPIPTDIRERVGLPSWLSANGLYVFVRVIHRYYSVV